jgi:hypothetical protein
MGAIDANLLEEEMSGTVPTDDSHRGPNTGNDGQVLDESMWKVDRPWEEKWESLKVNESKMTEQALDDEDRQARIWRHRPDRDPATNRGSAPYRNTRPSETE